MSAPRWTPGPWVLTDDNRARRVIRSAGPKPRTVCIIEEWTTEADARLIAAAPLLWKALRDLLHEDGPSRNSWERARAALAKAEGK